MSWIQGVLIAIDQLGNAIAGGNPDATISARTGYFANGGDSKLQFYWKTMEYIINFAFYQIDGPDHCCKALLADKDESHKVGSDLMRAVLGLIIIATSLPIAIVTRIYVLVAPKAKFDQTQNRATK